MARALEGRRRSTRPKRTPPSPNTTCSKCCPTPAARCTSATSAITPSATRSPATCGCAATTCCIPWAGTRSVCPPKTPPSQNNRPPREWTLANIEKMKRTHRRFAFSYDWDREVTTCEPEYYRWNQWFFLRMLERGLAYRKQALVNWCPLCATVLANEQVVDGCCWRHEDTPVEQRALEQWFLRTTAYADDLLRRHRATGRRLARARAHHAAQLDRPQRRRGGRFHSRRLRPGARLHHPHRHHLRRDVPDPRAGARDRRDHGSTRSAGARRRR